MNRTLTTVAAALVLTLALLPAPSFADEKTKTAKLNELMDVTGMVRLIEQARHKNKSQALQYKQELLRQLKEGAKATDKETLDYFEAEYTKFVNSLEPKWTTAEAANKYVELYGARMTEGEIDKVLEYSKSDVGKKSLAVTNEIMPLWLEYLVKDSDAQFRDGVKNFMANMKKFLDEKAQAQKAPQKP
jgi:hypothetical protein